MVKVHEDSETPLKHKNSTITAFKAVYTNERVDKDIFGKVTDNIKAELATDSEPLIKSIAYTMRVTNLNVLYLVDNMRESVLEA